MPEVILILAVGLIVIGPKKLPELAKSLGKGIVEFKRATQDFRDTINVENEVEDLRDTVGAIKSDIKHQITDKPESSKNKPQKNESTNVSNNADTTVHLKDNDSQDTSSHTDATVQLKDEVSQDTSPQPKDRQPAENHEK